MTRRLLQLFVAAALIVAVGGHWAALQSIAWVSMTVKFSRTVPLSVALEKTFDGRHPCQLCKVVAEGKKSEQQQSAPKLETKVDFLCLSQPVTFYPPPFSPADTSIRVAPDRAHTPPSPPPRRA